MRAIRSRVVVGFLAAGLAMAGDAAAAPGAEVGLPMAEGESIAALEVFAGVERLSCRDVVDRAEEWEDQGDLERGGRAARFALFHPVCALTEGEVGRAIRVAGLSLSAAGDPARAVSYLEEAVSRKQTRGRVWYALGMAHAELGRVEEGKRFLEIAHQPRNIRLLSPEEQVASKAILETPKPAPRVARPKRPRARAEPEPCRLAKRFSGAKLDLLETRRSRRVVRKPREAFLLHFWASWCIPCLKEMPELIQMSDRFRDQGLTLVLITEDREPERVARFVEKMESRFGQGIPDHLPLYSDLGGGLREKLTCSRDLPQTLLVGTDGKVHKHWTGDPGWESESVLRRIRRALEPGRTARAGGAP